MRFLLPCTLALTLAVASAAARTISVLVDPNLGPPSRHGLAKLTEALQARGWTVEAIAPNKPPHGERIVLVSLAAIPDAVRNGSEPKTGIDWPQSTLVRKFVFDAKPALLLSGADDRGLMYAELDAADRIGWAPDPADPFSNVHEGLEQPQILDRELSVYTMNRAYWESRFYDDAYWTRYLDLLAADRFTRLLIIFGYENGGFLAPPYPYFFDTPGFPGVHMAGLTAAQQQRNLTAMNHLIDLAHERGIDVSLGIWDHIYRAGVQTGGAEWVNDYHGRPIPNTVEGVTTENLNAYTLASLKELLARVPAIDGIQFRIHEESGLKREEMDGFWRVVFTEMKKLRPNLLLEARAKGTPDSVINTALDLGLNLRVETKYWMEQMGLPFHPIHVNPPDQMNRRHGYADLLRYPQRYQIDWRLWNGGTSRVLLWGNPEYVRRYDATTAIYHSPNWDVQEPLATKMEAQRPEMAPFDLMPAQYRYYDYEFERYWYFYQVWGRLGYNPATPSDVWDHEFERRFGPAGADLEAGLNRASEVLPMIVTAVYPYRLFPTTRGWAERQSLGARLADYSRNEGTDTELIENFADAAKRILAGGATAKRTPEITSRWFDAAADSILASVTAAKAKFTVSATATDATSQARRNEFDSTITDLEILAQLARFHARRAIAAVHYQLYLGERAKPENAENPRAGAAELIAATESDAGAVEAWRRLVAAAGDRYTFDLAMGARNYDLCGHWRDELPKLEADLTDLETKCRALPAPTETAWKPRTAGDLTGPKIDHQRILTARAGERLRIVARVQDLAGVASVVVKYRHLTQFEDYTTVVLTPMSGRPDLYSALLPSDAISPDWDFMYFLEAIDQAGNGAIWPDPMKEMPYVVVSVHAKPSR